MYYDVFIICNNCFYSSDLCKESKSPKTSLKKRLQVFARSTRNSIKGIFCREDANRPNKKERRKNPRRSRKSCCFPTCFGREKGSSIDENDSVCHYLSHSTSEESENNSLPLSDYTCGRFVQFLSDGTRVVEVTKPPHKPYGFFTARRKVGNSKGTFVTRMRDCESSIFLSGLLDVGDEIIEVDKINVKEKDIDEVDHLIMKKNKVLLKILPRSK
ncbi:uncharacterized protein LOC143243385 [Tachypleus tridentatus]|uniref:uncharacterized protein LOC143243385 n=1 Tax=Tachypleus tridentatus TaxID=6853 RepID=UPI003FCF3B23